MNFQQFLHMQQKYCNLKITVFLQINSFLSYIQSFKFINIFIIFNFQNVFNRIILIIFKFIQVYCISQHLPGHLFLRIQKGPPGLKFLPIS